MSGMDGVARGLATQARSFAAATAALPRDRFDGSIVAMGDSITANSLQFYTVATSSDSWMPKGIFAMLVARSGGRLRPVRIAGWPYAPGTGFGGIAQVLVARGGAGYSPATTLSFQTGVGGSGAAATPIIVGGVIVGVTVSAEGANFAQSPIVTVTDPGGGSGAVLTAMVRGAGQYAIGGIDTQQMEAFVPLVLASGARTVLYMGGTNNQGHGLSLADSKASILSTMQRLVAGGVRPIAIAPIDRDGSSGNGPRRYVAELRRWFVDQLPALAPGTVVVDPTPFFTDPNLDNTPAGFLTDGLHPSCIGADAIARLVWQQIAPLFPGGGYLTALSNTWDQYDATLQPGGNLLPQALVRTGTGVAPGSGEAPWTGTRANNLWLSRVSGGTGTGTIVASQEVRSDGRLGTRQMLTVNVTGATQGEIYRLTWSANGSLCTLALQGANVLQVGDTVRGAIDEVALSNVAGLRGMKLKLLASNTTAITPNAAAAMTGLTGAAAWGDWEDNNFPAWNGDTLFLQTRELVIPASSFGLTMHLDFVVNAGAASFTAKLFGASLRKVV